jgi:hypothetical protein
MDTGGSSRFADQKFPSTAVGVIRPGTLLSSGCHLTELREGTWTLAQNFGRTVGVVSAGSSKNDTSLRQRLDDIE